VTCFSKDNVENEEPRRLDRNQPARTAWITKKDHPRRFRKEKSCLSSADWDNELVRGKYFVKKESCLPNEQENSLSRHRGELEPGEQPTNAKKKKSKKKGGM